MIIRTPPSNQSHSLPSSAAPTESSKQSSAASLPDSETCSATAGTAASSPQPESPRSLGYEMAKVPPPTRASAQVSRPSQPHSPTSRPVLSPPSWSQY